MSKLTIETLENMFVYLGCANIPTQSAMDGAIPIESLLGGSKQDATVSCFTMSELEQLGTSWSTRAIWFAGDRLGLSTVENVHWSRISIELDRYAKTFMTSGWAGGRRSFTDDVDGFVRLYYSEIDKFGRFEKFPVKRKRVDSLVVSRLYNPDWLIAFRDGQMEKVHSDSDQLFRDKGLSFLAPFLCGLAQSLGSYWLVRTRFDDVCPSLTLLTDPTGVKEFWKLRDIPSGHRRRTALLHWVEQHWRQTRSDPDVEAFVRKHMRGETDIKQGKFEAHITPSTRDSLDEQKAIQQREMLRKLKLDRRKRRKTLVSK